MKNVLFVSCTRAGLFSWLKYHIPKLKKWDSDSMIAESLDGTKIYLRTQQDIKNYKIRGINFQTVIVDEMISDKRVVDEINSRIRK